MQRFSSRPSADTAAVVSYAGDLVRDWLARSATGHTAGADHLVLTMYQPDLVRDRLRGLPSRASEAAQTMQAFVNALAQDAGSSAAGIAAIAARRACPEARVPELWRGGRHAGSGHSPGKPAPDDVAALCATAAGGPAGHRQDSVLSGRGAYLRRPVPHAAVRPRDGVVFAGRSRPAVRQRRAGLAGEYGGTEHCADPLVLLDEIEKAEVGSRITTRARRSIACGTTPPRPSWTTA